MNYLRIGKALTLGIFLVLCLATAPFAQERDEKGGIQEVKIIHADSMSLTWEEKEPQILKGKVKIQITDQQSQQFTIMADKISIYYLTKKKELEKVVAEGRVEIIRPEGNRATTELAVYHGRENKIELLIDPKVEDTRGEMTANKITINLETETALAEGNVKGIVYPERVED